MKKTPAIATRRQQEATAKFKHKLDVLDTLISEGDLERFCKRASLSAFAAWVDVELKVEAISRSIIYDDETDEYIELRKRMEALLKRITALRRRAGKKVNLESDLKRQLEDAQACAQSYVNQYTAAKAELVEARKEIERLNNKLRRHIASSAKVSPLRPVPPSSGPTPSS